MGYVVFEKLSKQWKFNRGFLWYRIYCLRKTSVETSLAYAFAEFFRHVRRYHEIFLTNRSNILSNLNTLFSDAGLWSWYPDPKLNGYPKLKNSLNRSQCYTVKKASVILGHFFLTKMQTKINSAGSYFTPWEFLVEHWASEYLRLFKSL